MSRRSPRRHYVLPLVITGLLLASVIALGTLQWRWIGELSALERQRMLASLQESAGRFGEDFDRELTRAFLFFHPDRPRGGRYAGTGESEDRLEAQLLRASEQYRRWQAEVPEPRMVAALYLMRASEAGVELRVLRPGTADFVPAPWPAGFERLRERLGDRGRTDEVWDPADPPTSAPSASGSVPTVGARQAWGLLLPLSVARGTLGGPSTRNLDEAGERPPADDGREGRDRRREPARTRDYLFVQLDLDVLATDFLPQLMRRHFTSALGAEYVVAILDARHPERVVYRSDPAGPVVDAVNADLALGMFGLRPFEDLRSLWSPRFAPPLGAPRGGLAWGRLIPNRQDPRAGFAWTLVVRRRDGSLEAAVEAVRRRNLAVSAGVLGLLAVTATILAVGAQRAERLARQQLEFVAGVTHELNTPLTAIRSAGENLADGVVHEPVQVRRYGKLIETEGRRLSGMVSQVLEFAGLQAGRRAVPLESVPVNAVLDGALRDSRWLLQEAGITVEREVGGDVPPVMADAAALQRALQNLIENAVKYGGAARWIGVGAANGARGTVELSVADRGPGVAKEDLAHLFEPFYRGREAVASGVRGSGLGLSLVRQVVKAHGGSVAVEPGPGGIGSVFRLVLPAATRAAAGASEAALAGRSEEPA